MVKVQKVLGSELPDSAGTCPTGGVARAVGTLRYVDSGVKS